MMEDESFVLTRLPSSRRSKKKLEDLTDEEYKKVIRKRKYYEAYRKRQMVKEIKKKEYIEYCMICHAIFHCRLSRVRVATLYETTKNYLPIELQNEEVLLVCNDDKDHLKNRNITETPPNAYWNKKKDTSAVKGIVTIIPFDRRVNEDRNSRRSPSPKSIYYCGKTVQNGWRAVSSIVAYRTPYILNGILNLAQYIFGIWAGFQCLPICVIALLKSETLPFKSWTSSEISEVLLAGHRLYKKILKTNNSLDKPRFVELSEVSNESVAFQSKKFQVEFISDEKVFDVRTKIGISNYLPDFFTKYSSGIVMDSSGCSSLFTCQENSFYIFDSHSCTRTGRRAKWGSGNIMKLKNIPDLCVNLLSKLENSTEFTFHGISLTLLIDSDTESEIDTDLDCTGETASVLYNNLDKRKLEALNKIRNDSNPPKENKKRKLLGGPHSLEIVSDDLESDDEDFEDSKLSEKCMKTYMENESVQDPKKKSKVLKKISNVEDSKLSKKIKKAPNRNETRLETKTKGLEIHDSLDTYPDLHSNIVINEALVSDDENETEIDFESAQNSNKKPQVLNEIPSEQDFELLIESKRIPRRQKSSKNLNSEHSVEMHYELLHPNIVKNEAKISDEEDFGDSNINEIQVKTEIEFESVQDPKTYISINTNDVENEADYDCEMEDFILPEPIETQSLLSPDLMPCDNENQPENCDLTIMEDAKHVQMSFKNEEEISFEYEES